MDSERIKRGLAHLLAGVALASAAILPAGAAERQGPDVRIGWTAWSDAEVISKLTALVLSKVGMDVELTLADVSAQYRGLAENDLDVMLMSWQPQTHAGYLRRYGDRIEDLGPLYGGADLGLAVPTYVDSSIRTIGDLAGAAERFDRHIEGIDEGAGLMDRAHEAMTAYGLRDWELASGSGPRMALRLNEAIERQQPIVVTAWRPHWKWAAFDLRYLKDPEGVFKGEEAVHAMAREGFSGDQPKVAAFLERMQFELDELETLMAEARDKGHRTAIREWLNANGERVTRWLEGD